MLPDSFQRHRLIIITNEFSFQFVQRVKMFLMNLYSIPQLMYNLIRIHIELSAKFNFEICFQCLAVPNQIKMTTHNFSKKNYLFRVR